MIRYIFSLFASVILLSSTVFAQTAGQNAVTRQQAISHLGQLVDVHAVELNTNERGQIISVCRQLQTTTVQDLNDKLSIDLGLFTDAAANFRWGINYVTSNLRGMSEDTSGLDLASVHLNDIESDIRDAARIYQRSLDEVLIIDCQVYPEEFVAGIEEVKDRKALMQTTAEGLTDFFDVELTKTYQDVGKRLERIEAQ